MAKVRSPNYPAAALGSALLWARKVFDKDNRNKTSRAAVAKHLGHDSLSGPALGKIGALRAYGLVEGTGDELRISDDAVTAMMAPEGSVERLAARRRLALKPQLFQDIQKEFPTLPSEDNLRFWLIKRQFTGDAAAKASKAYLATMRVAEGEPESYNSSDEAPEIEPEVETPAPSPLRAPAKAKIMDGERELTTGLLSKDASFRLIVSGNVGVKEIERLIKKLELDKEILADTESSSYEERPPTEAASHSASST
ncbi:MAG TPA: hypothetical protein VKV77_03595 [Methylovirgula sp.]|nr:hypothetical protein [Methylovirgula sp.]